jgi:D-sedoheptulose 7-phosphate isomerase
VLDHVRDAMKETAQRLTKLAADESFLRLVDKAGLLIAGALLDRHTIFSCGNGGSMCDAMHFAEELSGRFREDREPLAALAISDPAHMSCTANDYGYEHVFSRFLQAHCSQGDVLIAISTSGRSPNILAAARVMKQRGGLVIALTGRNNSELGSLVDIDLSVGSTGYADRAQEVHVVLLHSLIEIIESEITRTRATA